MTVSASVQHQDYREAALRHLRVTSCRAARRILQSVVPAVQRGQNRTMRKVCQILTNADRFLRGSADQKEGYRLAIISGRRTVRESCARHQSSIFGRPWPTDESHQDCERHRWCGMRSSPRARAWWKPTTLFGSVSRHIKNAIIRLKCASRRR
jgi:hypothetical protein